MLLWRKNFSSGMGVVGIGMKWSILNLIEGFELNDYFLDIDYYLW